MGFKHATQPTVPSPFGLRRELEIETQAGPPNALLPVVDAGQGNPCNFGHSAVRQAFAEVCKIAAAVPSVSTGHIPLPSLNGYLWRIVAFLSQELHLDTLDVLRAIVAMVHAAKYPQQPQPRIVEQAVMEYIQRVHAVKNRVLPSGILLTSGASAGAQLVLRALINGGILRRSDEVIVLAPIYSPIVELCIVNQLTVVPVQQPYDLQGISGELKARIESPETKLLILVHPGNPSGHSYSASWLEAFRQSVSRRSNLLVIEDAAYAPFIPGMLSVWETIPRHTILLGSFSKIVGMCGARIGYIAIAPENLADELLGHHRVAGRYLSRIRNPSAFVERCWLEAGDISFSHTGSVSSHSMILGLFFATLWWSDPDAASKYQEEVRQELASRYTSLFRGLYGERDHAVVPVPPCAYHAWLDLGQVIEFLLGSEHSEWLRREQTTLDFVRHLARSQKAIVLPGEGFRSPSSYWVRACVGNLEGPQECYELGRRVNAGIIETLRWRGDAAVMSASSRSDAAVALE